MTRKILVITLSIVAGWFGCLSIGGAILVKDINPVVRIAILVNGIILFVGVGSLLNHHKSAGGWLFLSAILYYMIAWLDKVLTYGMCSIILPFIAQFYWSLGIRVLLAVVAYALSRDSREGV
jgi:hypothetical protein